jgi:glutathione synthase
MPDNQTRKGLVSGLAVAHHAYIAKQNGNASVLFVVQAGERNLFDQRLLEYELFDRQALHEHFF